VRKKLVAALFIGGMTVGLGAAGASAHPIETPGHSGFVAGSSQGHVHGLECAARKSPVIQELGLPCAADGRN
jgi:hypothetical protein